MRPPCPPTPCPPLICPCRGRPGGGDGARRRPCAPARWATGSTDPSVDNTACERAIRPFAIARRNWLFADTPNGASASANLYSLIETAKANGHEPYRYRHFLFTQLPGASTPEEIAALLPLSLAPDAVPQP
jgi:hypothetical protein